MGDEQLEFQPPHLFLEEEASSVFFAPFDTHHNSLPIIITTPLTPNKELK